MSSARAIIDLPEVPPVGALPDLVPPATRQEARARSSELARLLRAEREIAADFLLGVADFDRRRGWEALGYRSLFDYLVRDLGLSLGAASLRLTAARLLTTVPEVEAALRCGKLCLSAVGELAKVVTPLNRAEVLPRFLGLSARKAREVAAALMARPELPTRDLVRSLSTTQVHVLRTSEMGEGSVPPAGESDRSGHDGTPSPPETAEGVTGPATTSTPSTPSTLAPPRSPPVLEASTDRMLANRGATVPRDDLEPLDAERFRLHATVSRRFLEKVKRARAVLSRRAPRASLENVLEAALDALIAKHHRAHGLGARAVKAHAAKVELARAAQVPAVDAGPKGVAAKTSPPPAGAIGELPCAKERAPRRPIPAAVEREVRLRDGERCQYRLDSGGFCGTTHRVELDHVLPLALGGETSAANLRCLCAFHHRLESERVLGRGLAGLRPR